MHELIQMALTHDMIIMTVILLFVILGVMLLISTVRRARVKPERVLSRFHNLDAWSLKSCDICYRGPYDGEKLGGWRYVEDLCVCSDCSSNFP